jgi:uncharacterized membrane protein
MDGRNLVESLIRWVHVLAGILWIGQLWFFNWVNASFTPTMDAETKQKVVPELMPRALYFFRWGAAWTWVTGLLLLGLVYHATGLQFADPGGKRVMAGGILTLVALLMFAVYDPLAKAIPKPEVQAVVGLVAVAVLVWAFTAIGRFGWRGAAIHVGVTFGTIMAANVWMRIWPAQRKIIAAVKAGEKPDPVLVAQAGLRSKHNTYLSVPLVFTMLAQHATWAAGIVWALPAVVALGWVFTFWVYKKAATLKGV